MADKITTINLLPRESENFTTQFFNWALSIGRLLIILTEMIALGTFLFRFGLDMQIVDLHDKIKTDSFIVTNFSDAETTFRDIQDRLLNIKQYTSVEKTTTSIFSDITKMGQGKVTFNDLNVSTQSVRITLGSPSPSAISQFVESLKNYPNITSVTVDKVTDSPSSAQITVDITALLKPAAFAPPNQQTGNLSNAINQTVLPNQ